MLDPTEVVDTSQPAATDAPDARPDVTMPDAEPHPGGAPTPVDAAQIKAEYEAKLQAMADEKAKVEKMLADNRAFIINTRNVKANEPVPEKPAKTFDEYVAERKKEFEDDPATGFERFMRDIAAQNALDRADYEKRIAEAEGRAVKKVMALDPERGQAFKAVQELEETRPDLANLTFEQKLEFLSMQKSKSDDPGQARLGVDIDRERDLAAGTPRGTVKRSATPAWLNDPAVLREAQGHFSSKEEMAMWADPDRAMQAYLKKRAAQG